MEKWKKYGFTSDITTFSVLAIFAFATLVPFIWVLLSAFKSNSEIFGSTFSLPQSWNWENFVIAWTDGRFDIYFWNSIFSSVMVTFILIVIACPAGYAFAKLRLKQYPIVFYIFLFGMTLPAQSVLVPLFYQLRSYGLVDSLWGFIFAVVGLSTPFSIYLMRNFFRDLPDSIGDAGRIDGAGEWGVFWRIMLPLSRPGVLALAVFSFLSAWNEFLLAILLLVSDDKRTIPLGVLRFTDLHTSDYGVLFSAVVIGFIPSVLIYVLLQRQFISGLASGANK